MYRKKEEKISISQLMIKGTVYLYVLLMVGLFPIFFLESSIPLISAKIILYKSLNVIMLCMCFLAAIAWISQQIIEKNDQKIKLSFGIMDGFALILAAAMLISTFVSTDMQEAFWGTQGKKFGAFILLTCVVNYFLISRFFKLDQIVIWAYMLGSSIAFALQVVNQWGFNPLELWSKSQQFASTIGNINLNAAYDVLMLAIGMGLFFIAKEKVSEYVYGGYLYLGFCGLLCCRSDLGIVGIAAGFLVLAGFKLGEKEGFLKYMKLVILFGLSAGSIALGNVVGAKYVFRVDSLVAFLTAPCIPILLIAVGVLMIIVCRFLHNHNEDKFIKRIHIIYIFLVAVLIIAGFSVFILVNTVWKDITVPELLEMLKFTDSFASDRGFIWIRSLEVYFQNPWKYKLFGFGANCFPDFINPMYYEEMVNSLPIIFIDAHNEFLQMLATTGLLGIFGYFGMLLTSLVRGIRNIHKNVAAVFPVIVISSLLAQGMFYSPHVTVTPLIIIFLSIAEAERRNKGSGLI